MAVINIDDAYILGETGAQVDKVTGLFTKDENTDAGEKAFAQLNIGTAGSNRNLLDNPWFTVNQREAASVSDGYPADRWLKVGNTAATATATANGLVIAINGSGYCDLRNRYSEAEIITPNLGKTATISAMLADGTVFSDQIVLNTTQQNRYLNSEKIRFNLSVSGGVYLVRLVLYDDMTICAVKLELGSVSTLANDAPPDYGQELAKCQRYFYRMKSIGSAYPFEMGFATSATNFRVVLPTHCSMRTPVQSVTMNGGNFYAYGNGVAAGLTSVSYTGWVPNGIVVTFTTSGLTAAAIYALMCNNASSYIDISCDI